MILPIMILPKFFSYHWNRAGADFNAKTLSSQRFAEMLKIVGRERLKTFSPLRRTGTRLEGFQPFQPYNRKTQPSNRSLWSLFALQIMFSASLQSRASARETFFG